MSGVTEGDGGTEHLDATGPRSVVYCHSCSHEWYQDTAGLICPRCDGDIIEIISPESDPRMPENPLLGHNPWRFDNPPDPDEADIDELTAGMDGAHFFQNMRSTDSPDINQQRGNIRDANNDGGPLDHLQTLLQMIGPLSQSQGGRGFDHETQYQTGTTFRGEGGSNGDEYTARPIFRGTIRRGTFTFGNVRSPLRTRGTFDSQSRDLDDMDMYAPPPSQARPQGQIVYLFFTTRRRPDEVVSLLDGVVGPQPTAEGHEQNGMGLEPPILAIQQILSQFLQPRNAQHGDVVYTQEAFDRVITAIMEGHNSSNAPGPASPDDIASLPKICLTEKELGPEGKGECSVCMDDVKLGDEVVQLSCTHWFHEACASSWLSEHNTCPICRKGIGASSQNMPQSESTSSQPRTQSRRSSAQRTASGGYAPSGSSRIHRSSTRERSHDLEETQERTRRNEARIDRIRNAMRPESGERRSNRQSRASSNGTDDNRPWEHMADMPGVWRNDSASGMSSGTENRWHRDYRRTSPSSVSQERDLRRNSRSRNSSGSASNSSGGAMSWLRDHLPGANRRRD